MINTTIFPVFMLCLCVATACSGANLPQHFTAKEGFTLHLPEDWKPIPKDILDKYSQVIAKMAPQAEKQVYDYGFQRNDTQKWFSYPYILVQVKRSGRIPEEQLNAFKRIKKALVESFTKTTDSLSSVTSNASLGEPMYDPVARILWTRIAIDVKSVGTVQGIIGTILTEEGFVQIACYSRDHDFTGFLPVFETIIRNTDISDSLKYGAASPAGKAEMVDPAKNTKGKSVSNNIRWGMLFGIIFGCFIAGGFVRILKKGSATSPNYNKTQAAEDVKQSFTNDSAGEGENSQEQSFGKTNKKADNSSYEYYYNIFGLEPGTSLEVLKQKYRDLVTVWHPDRFVGNPRLQKEAEEKLKQLNNAYEVLLSLYSKT